MLSIWGSMHSIFFCSRCLKLENCSRGFSYSQKPLKSSCFAACWACTLQFSFRLTFTSKALHSCTAVYKWFINFLYGNFMLIFLFLVFSKFIVLWKCWVTVRLSSEIKTDDYPMYFPVLHCASFWLKVSVSLFVPRLFIWGSTFFIKNQLQCILYQVAMGADHRIVDGATVARFCNEWKQLVENPELMLLHMTWTMLKTGVRSPCHCTNLVLTTKCLTWTKQVKRAAGNINMNKLPDPLRHSQLLACPCAIQGNDLLG